MLGIVEIVVVEKGDELILRRLHPRIRGLGTATRRFMLDQRHAVDVRRCAAVIHDDDLRRIAGRADRRNRLGQQRRPIFRAHDDADRQRFVDDVDSQRSHRFAQRAERRRSQRRQRRRPIRLRELHVRRQRHRPPRVQSARVRGVITNGRLRFVYRDRSVFRAGDRCDVDERIGPQRSADFVKRNARHSQVGEERRIARDQIAEGARQRHVIGMNLQRTGNRDQIGLPLAKN